MADNGNYSTTTSYNLETALGGRLAQIRLARNITQKTLAMEAGIGLRTLRRLETGQSSTLDSFLRVAIALGFANDLLSAIPLQEIRPIERVNSRRSGRKRARPAKAKAPAKPWSWGTDLND